MCSRAFCRFVLILVAALILPPLSAVADRAGWNEPGREPGYDQDGLLQINTDFFELSAATGGDFYYWAPGEFAQAAGVLAVPITSDPILLAYAAGGGPFSHTWDIPVDGTLSRLDLFAGAQRLDQLRLLRPDGRSVEVNPAGVTTQVFRHMRILTIVDPEPGLWQVEFHGEGSFDLAVRYLADRSRLRQLGLRGIDLVDFEFVELKGRPGHKGLFPLAEPPSAGAEQQCRLALTGVAEPPVVELVSAAGVVLAEVSLDEPTEVGSDEFLGRCRVPEQPFRVRVRGKDAQGWPFQRLTSGLTTPSF